MIWHYLDQVTRWSARSTGWHFGGLDLCEQIFLAQMGYSQGVVPKDHWR